MLHRPKWTPPSKHGSVKNSRCVAEKKSLNSLLSKNKNHSFENINHYLITTTMFANISKVSSNSGKAVTTNNSRNGKVSASLSLEDKAFTPLFDYSESRKAQLIGTLCKEVAVLEFDEQYNNLHIAFALQDFSDIFGADNVALLMSSADEVKGFDFPFSRSYKFPGGVVLRCKIAAELATIAKDAVGGTACVVIIPGAYKPFGTIERPGISARVIIICASE